MDDQISIRRVTKEDYKNIALVFVKAFDKHESVLKFYTKFDEYVGFCLNQGYAFVAEKGSDVIGVILGYEKPDHFCGISAYIELLAVLPDYQGKGCGKALIKQIEQVAKEKKITTLCLRTGCYMESYLIYRHLGFIDTRDDQRFLVRRIVDSC